jgi:aldehyde dehydrogenase (NAD+)
MANSLRDYQGLYVNGKWIAPESAEPVINPATEQAIARIPVGDQRTLDEAIAAARTAFDEGPWPRMRPAERSAPLMQFHGELAARSEEIAGRVVAESGASQMLARFLHVQSSLVWPSARC